MVMLTWITHSGTVDTKMKSAFDSFLFHFAVYVLRSGDNFQESAPHFYHVES